jgi:hypothetical protein
MHLILHILFFCFGFWEGGGFGGGPFRVCQLLLSCDEGLDYEGKRKGL